MGRIAIVGGTSALARRLIPLLQAGNEVATLGLGECDVPCDLTGPVDAIRIPEGTEAVVHVAAAFGGSTDDEILQTVETNAVGTLKVCMAAKKAAVRHLVYISSIYAQLDELSPHYGIYSITKRQAEELAADYCRRGSLKFTALRAAPLYGEETAFRRHQPFFYHLADCAERGQDISIYGRHDALRNYIHADDVARIVRGVLEKGCGGLYPCTFPRDVALSEVAAAAQKAFGQGGKVVFLPEKPDIPDNVFGTGTELYDRLGFRPEVDVWEGMRRLARHRKAARA